ncbi:MAG: efflux RND transporter periplasmic adaptor subunit [Dysgonomonas mossii]|uniref:efflux RND transporter periplasmic adaptor subunit n=1 Tax=Dysgonomonas mossii TaxID=163665 RepID=UPI0026EB60A7|nr:efflux RND transporter periplasmic adaptor subunit [Dysgonomonas mossii]MBS5907502.1 efflux RND transporter periplasmic adaptor subunit [Dysgonomonas mossii]
MRKNSRIQYLGIILILISSSIGAIFFSEKQSERQIKLNQTIIPQRNIIIQKKVISGNLYPIKEIEVKSAIAGILDSYYVQIGDKVRKGDRIAKIKILSEPTQIENAKMNLRTAGIQFEKDRLNYKREQQLFEKGVIARAEFEEISKTYQISKEQYDYAQNQLSLLQEGYIPSSNVSNVVIATADGILIDLPLEEGTPVVERNNFRDGTTVALIAQLDSFLFKGKIIENDVLALRKGMKLNVLPTSMEGFQTEAIIRKISPKGYWDQGTMKYDVEAVFTFPDSVQIYSGFNATAEFILNEKENVLTIPIACLRFQNDSAFVEVLRDGEFEKIYIETGISDGVNIEILKGINPDNKIKK